MRSLCVICSSVLAFGNFNDWWPELQNPVIGYKDWSVKDAYLIVRDDMCYAFFSSFYPRILNTSSHVVAVKGERCQNWSEPYLALDGHSDGWKGVCSPSVKPIPGGGWVLAYNSWGDKVGKPNQLLYRTSPDLLTWSDVRPLAQNLTAGYRFIDADVTYDTATETWILLAKGKAPDPITGKKGDHPYMFLSNSSLDGPWTEVLQVRLQRADGSETKQLENWDMFMDGKGIWRIFATSLSSDSKQLPILFSQETIGDFSSWINGTVLRLPEQSFNTKERGNAAAISTDVFASTGYYVMIYAGTTEKVDFSGRGDNKLGLARSRDLYNWESASGSDIMIT